MIVNRHIRISWQHVSGQPALRIGDRFWVARRANVLSDPCHPAQRLYTRNEPCFQLHSSEDHGQRHACSDWQSPGQETRPEIPWAIVVGIDDDRDSSGAWLSPRKFEAPFKLLGFEELVARDSHPWSNVHTEDALILEDAPNEHRDRFSFRVPFNDGDVKASGGRTDRVASPVRWLERDPVLARPYA